MDELSKALRKSEVNDEALERRLLKRVRVHMRRDRERIKSGRISESAARKKAELAAVEELLSQTNEDLEKL